MAINYGAHLNQDQDDSTSHEAAPTAPLSEKGQAGLDYAALGLRIHPLHSVRNGVCSCRKGAKCGSDAGKHPRFKGWRDQASNDAATVAGWWRQWPDANIGWSQGAEFGCFQLDIDNEQAECYVNKHTPVSCPIILTGKGYRMIFRHPGGRIKTRSRILENKEIGLDVMADGGNSNTVLPPSMHYSGIRYEWMEGASLADFPDGPPDAPDWVLELVQPKPAQAGLPLFAQDVPQKEAPARKEPKRREEKGTAPPSKKAAHTGQLCACGKPTAKRGFTRCHACHAEWRREARLAASLEILASATPGNLNTTLNEQSYFIGMLVGAGHLTQSEAESAIERDAPHIFRKNRSKGVSTMTRALEAGARNPGGLNMPDFDDHEAHAPQASQQPANTKPVEHHEYDAPPVEPVEHAPQASEYHDYYDAPPIEPDDQPPIEHHAPPAEQHAPLEPVEAVEHAPQTSEHHDAPPVEPEWEERRQVSAAINQRRMTTPAHAKDVATVKQMVSRLDKAIFGRKVGEAIKGVIGEAGEAIWRAWSGQPNGGWDELEPLPDGLQMLTEWADQDDPPYKAPVAEFSFDELKAKIEEAIDDEEVTKHDLAEMIDEWTDSAAHLKGREVNRLCKLLKRGKVTARILQHWRADIKEVQEEIEAEKEENEKEQSVTGAILDALDSLGYSFRLNECNGHIEINGENLDDPLAATIRSQMRDLGFKSMPAIEDAYIMHARNCRYHPIKDYLRGLRNQWDGVDYIAQLASHFTDDHNPVVCDDGVKRSLTHIYLRRWVVGAVAKVFGDGKAQNQCIVFEGKQGIGKSYMARWLAGVMPDYFIEDEVKPSNKDHKLRLTDNWIWEIAELGATTRKADVEALKHFITTGTIKVRPPYGRYAINKPAVTSFFGTVNNNDGFLQDRTGNRRFWVISIVDVDKRYSKRMTPAQIWGQAVGLYLAGETGELTEIEIEARETNNTRYQVTNPAEDWIFRYFREDPDGVTLTTDIVQTLQEKNYRGTTKSIQMDVSSTLRSLGFEKERVTVRGQRGMGFHGIAKIVPACCPLCGEEESKTFFKFKATRFGGAEMWHCKTCHNPNEGRDAFWPPEEIENL